MCVPYIEPQNTCGRFIELGEQLSRLVSMGKGRGGAAVVARPFEGAMREVNEALDVLIRRGKN